MDIIVDPQKVIIQRQLAEGYCLGTTQNAFGNVIAVLENDFPEIKNISGNEYGKMVADHLSKGLSGNRRRHTETYWNLNISSDDVYNVLNFMCYFDGQDKIKLSMQDVEIWRIRHFLKKAVSPLDWLSANDVEGIRIDGITSIYDVVYALLFYYAMNDFKLVKCEHCGRWFATDSFKHKFCSRNSPVPGYTHKNCEQAVQNIRQQCARVRNRIDAKARLTAATGGSPFQDWFWHECNRRIEAIKKHASAERQIEYLGFLKEAENSKAWLDNSCLESVD